MYVGFFSAMLIVIAVIVVVGAIALAGLVIVWLSLWTVGTVTVRVVSGAKRSRSL